MGDDNVSKVITLISYAGILPKVLDLVVYISGAIYKSNVDV